MRIPIVKDGYRFIVPLGVLTAVLWLVAPAWSAAVCGGLFIFVLSFFRDPERVIPDDPKAVVSPADGRIVEIVSETDPLLGEPRTRVSIFLSVFNVHVNRMPVAGRVETTRYNPGKFLAAFDDKASLDNEQNSVVINDGNVTILVKQIAGLIARRIVCWANKGDEYERGQRFGLIRFGSRVDILIPENTKLNVALKDRVRGGSSVIGYLP